MIEVNLPLVALQFAIIVAPVCAGSPENRVVLRDKVRALGRRRGV